MVVNTLEEGSSAGRATVREGKSVASARSIVNAGLAEPRLRLGSKVVLFSHEHMLGIKRVGGVAPVVWNLKMLLKESASCTSESAARPFLAQRSRPHRKAVPALPQDPVQARSEKPETTPHLLHITVWLRSQQRGTTPPLRRADKAEPCAISHCPRRRTLLSSLGGLDDPHATVPRWIDLSCQ